MAINININIEHIRAAISKKGGKALFDLAAVLVIPLLFALGYYFWSGEDDSALLSLAVSQGDGREYGAKAKQALATLRSISMDASLFDDPVYRSLKEFHVDIDTSIPIGRSYPFTTPDVLRGKQKPVQSVPAR